MDWLKKTRTQARQKPDTISESNLKSRRIRLAVVGGTAIAGAILAVLRIHPTIVGPARPVILDPTSTGSIATKLGESHCEGLPDGSEVCLNSKSVIHYTFNRNTRNIEVVSGEASFVVRSDPRPFDVLSGGLLVHDLSTSFDVYKKRDAIEMTVIGGTVKVLAPITKETRRQFELGEQESAWMRGLEVRRLQQVQFDEATNTLHIRPRLTEPRLSQLLAWRSGEIDLNGRTLGEALDEFARYQPISRFIYSDPSIRTISVGGNMRFVNLDDFLAALAKEFHIRHTIAGADGNAVVTLSRQRNPGKYPRAK